MKSILAALAAATLSIAGASAQEVISNPRGMVNSLSFSDIEPVLREAGFQTQVQSVNGETLMVVDGMGKRLVLFPKACEGTSCAGLWMFAYLNSSSSMDAVNAFNQVSKPARASIANDKVVLDRYLIADYGTTRGSFVINVGVLVGMIDQWFQYSQSQGPIAVSFEPLLGATASPSSSTLDHDVKDMIRAMSTNPAFYNDNPSYEGRLN